MKNKIKDLQIYIEPRSSPTIFIVMYLLLIVITMVITYMTMTVDINANTTIIPPTVEPHTTITTNKIEFDAAMVIVAVFSISTLVFGFVTGDGNLVIQSASALTIVLTTLGDSPDEFLLPATISKNLDDLTMVVPGDVPPSMMTAKGVATTVCIICICLRLLKIA
jgi:hypothetical protein